MGNKEVQRLAFLALRVIELDMLVTKRSYRSTFVFLLS